GQRSDGSSSVTNGGRQRGVKLASGSRVARQEKRVLTNQSRPPEPKAISWIRALPVTWLWRGRKQASWLPAGSRRRATLGTSRNSQTWRVVPMASREPPSARAKPIGDGKEREGGVRPAPPSPAPATLPAR